MEFTHAPYIPGETIAAIATPPGDGGIAIVRISGDLAINVAEKVLRRSLEGVKSHHAIFGSIYNGSGERIDEGLILVMRAPRSYTGENTVELQCHGGSLIAREVLRACLDAGARSARPGEFSFRAFFHGKIDLAQAEAVQSLISAKNHLALSASDDQLKGKISERVKYFQKRMNDIAAILEAWVDFPEEGLEFASQEEVIAELEGIQKEINAFAGSFYDGRRIQEGISLALIGLPNVGKSSIMNGLLGVNRAIVTSIAGTTRDVLEEDLMVGGLHFRLVDTAGIRETTEEIEIEGISRSLEVLKKADVILLVLDASRENVEEGLLLHLGYPKEKTLVVWNKIDIASPKQIEMPHQWAISAKTGEGVEELRKKIVDLVWQKGPPSKEEIILTSSRHHHALKCASENLGAVIRGLQDHISPEFLTADMRESLSHLGQIVGVNVTEDILSAIFAKFCVGK